MIERNQDSYCNGFGSAIDRRAPRESDNYFQHEVDIPTALKQIGVEEPMFPTWLPEGFELAEQKMSFGEPVFFYAAYFSKEQFRVLRRPNENDEKYSKIKNTQIYKKAGLNTVPIYILDDIKCIGEMAEGIISAPLEADLRALSSNSVVIRTDIAFADKSTKQLLKRSNEIRGFEGIREWLFKQKDLILSQQNVAFLFHVFVPAIGAAFVNASHNGRIVIIEALWGLPEGLYYNAHDTITVDTKSVDSAIVSAESCEILSKKAAFKEYYIAPDENGCWIQKKTAVPHDWNLCIDDESIKQIAAESRIIAGLEEKSISVMWFLGIDEDYYGTRNLAWYHEEYTSSGFTTSAYRKKYFYEEETIIQNYDDFAHFQSSEIVRAVKIRPVDDDLLRSKDFLKSVGEEAQRRGAAIILEGTVLAHPLYQLCRTGARVLTINHNELYKEEAEYRKLVRDKIPSLIANNGEEVLCYILEDNAFIRALMEKAVEEAIEISASMNEEILEELGDEYEVLSSLIDLLEKNKYIDPLQQKNRVLNLSDCANIGDTIKFSLKNNLEHKSFLTENLGFVDVEISYEGARLQVTLHLSRGEFKKNQQKTRLTKEKRAESIFVKALSLTSYLRIYDVKRAVRSMQKSLIEFVEQQGCTESEFYEKLTRKRERRGGFTKGYFLKSSSLSSTADDNDNQYQIQMEQLEKEDYGRIEILDYTASRNTDYLDKGYGELVLRMSLPICFNHYSDLFETNAVKRYTGGCGLVADLERKKDMLYLNLYTKNTGSEYVQLSFSD